MDQNITSPTVSVLMPVYNCSAFIAEAIESILNQTCSCLELIIIDDCSTDNTREVISRFTDKRITLIKKNENSGYISSLNMAIEISKGEFIARMDGDDISHHNRLEKQVNFLNLNPDVALCGTWYESLSTKEVVENPVENEDIKIALLDYCALGHPTVMFRKAFVTANKLSYDQSFYPAEDYELWTRISALGKISNLPEALLYYRSHENQVSAKEQFRQVKNSYRCRIRMMCYPLHVPSEFDTRMSEKIVKNEKIDNSLKLKEMVDWLGQLLNMNELSGFYAEQKFKKHIANKQKSVIRSYHLHNTSYNPSVLYHFYKSGANYRDCFTLREHISFILKCVLCWK